MIFPYVFIWGVYCCRELIKSNQQLQHQLNSDYMYNTTTQMDSSSALPQPATMPESLLSFYQSNFCDPNKADSGLTYHIPLQRSNFPQKTLMIHTIKTLIIHVLVHQIPILNSGTAHSNLPATKPHCFRSK